MKKIVIMSRSLPSPHPVFFSVPKRCWLVDMNEKIDFWYVNILFTLRCAGGGKYYLICVFSFSLPTVITFILFFLLGF